MYGSNGKNMYVSPWVKSLKLKNPFIHPFSVLFLFLCFSFYNEPSLVLKKWAKVYIQFSTLNFNQFKMSRDELPLAQMYFFFNLFLFCLSSSVFFYDEPPLVLKMSHSLYTI